ncbi:efflux RND transporter periplasmic adaptor subunit [Maritalea mediterranea]|uniref:Efflux RND transporter periplasmic adaptor subunit n=1 Tax=Maritalea mediterranea TaxID=2909667 RepID=A0ABS9E6Q8_9HYPH|nr:efflux RND transporter periplasmic adaptor subunit [Maritalea mediterranea]MCF4097589.1 efflux RND transporter periplasmic adaptor subunit [Maritalea mediterranea]
MDRMMDQAEQTDQNTPPPSQQPKRKRGAMAIIGLFARLIITLAILAGAGFFAFQLVSSRPEPPERQARERTFTVRTIEATVQTAQPNLTYFGEIVAAGALDVRAQVAGEIVEIHPDLAVGNQLAQGDLIARIDDFTYRGALTEAKASLAEAQLAATEARERLQLERDNLSFAQEQLDLSKKDLERAQTLLQSGALTQKNVDDRELLVSQREQALKQRQANIAIQQAQLDRQLASMERFEWQVERAERNLANTEIRAPFDAVVSAESIAPGKIVNANEALVSLYRQDQLDVRFTMSDRQYGQIFADGLIGRPIRVVWEVEPQNLTAKGTITRAGAQIDAAKGGVEVFARLENAEASTFRPGTFVKILVPGRAYEDVIRLPETAIYDNRLIYTIEEGRMVPHDAEIMARDGAQLLVRADVADGAKVITTRLAQAGDGLAVVEEGEAPPIPPRDPARAENRGERDNPNGQEREGRRPPQQQTQASENEEPAS